MNTERPGPLLVAEIAERVSRPFAYAGLDYLAVNDVQALLAELDAASEEAAMWKRVAKTYERALSEGGAL